MATGRQTFLRGIPSLPYHAPITQTTLAVRGPSSVTPPPITDENASLFQRLIQSRNPITGVAAGEIGGGKEAAGTIGAPRTMQVPVIHRALALGSAPEESTQDYLAPFKSGKGDLVALAILWKSGIVPTNEMASALSSGLIDLNRFFAACRQVAGIGFDHLASLVESLAEKKRTVLSGLPSTQTSTPRLVDTKGYLQIRRGKHEGHESGDRFEGTKYLLQERIGSGGNSDVYRAIEEPSNREVAVKILRAESEMDRKALEEKIRDEMAHHKAYAHRGFVQVFNSGVTEGDDFFIVLELLKSSELERFIEDMSAGAVPYDLYKIIDVACDLLWPLVLMHDAGLIHRDVKPSNYFSDEEGPKLGDRGLAMTVTDPEMRVDIAHGTPEYLSPESLWGFNRPSRDVWAFGVVLYELLTFKLPFYVEKKNDLTPEDKQAEQEGEGEEERKQRKNREWLKQLSDLIFSYDPPKPSEKAPKGKVPGVVDAIVMKCLAKDLDLNLPPERYQTAGELMYDLLKVKFQAGIDAANAHLKEVDYIDPVQKRIKREAWLKGLENSLHELEMVYKKYPLKRILDERVNIYMQLYQGALKGEVLKEGLLEEAKNRILELDPESPEAKEVLRTFTVSFVPEKEGDALPPSRIQPFSYQGGILVPGPVPEKSEIRDSLVYDRGNMVVHFEGKDLVPVSIPWYVGADKNLRVPRYTMKEVPEAPGVLVTAGEGIRLAEKGSFSQVIPSQDKFFVGYDYYAMPLRTGADYVKFLHRRLEELKRKKLGPDSSEFRGILPYGWAWDPKINYYVYNHGEQRGTLVDMRLPVEFSDPKVVEEYLAFLSGELNFNCRNISINEWKRLLRGNDARTYPWGGSEPTGDMVVFNLANPSKMQSWNYPVALDVLAHHDFSPFSNRKNRITHGLGNVRKFTSHDSRDEMLLHALRFRISVDDLMLRHILTVGGNYADNPPDTPDVIGKHPLDRPVLAGIMPVVPLRDVSRNAA